MFITSRNFKLSYHATLADVYARRLVYETKSSAAQKTYMRRQLQYHLASLKQLHETKTAVVKQISSQQKEQPAMVAVH